MMSLVKKVLKNGLIIGTALASLSLGACGGGGGGNSNSNSPQTDYQAKIVGDVYNTGPVLSQLRKNVGKFILPNQAIAQNAQEEILSDVVLNDFIEVSATVKNLSTKDTLENVIVEILVEDPIFLTPEKWNCMKEFKSYDGHIGMGTLIWEEYGGIKGKEQQPPVRECSGPPLDPAFFCDNNVYDCSAGVDNINYEPPGSGFWSANGKINEIKPGEEIVTATGYRHGQMTTGSRLGIWTAKINKETLNSEGRIVGVEEQILDSKRYRFNIISN